MGCSCCINRAAARRRVGFGSSCACVVAPKSTDADLPGKSIAGCQFQLTMSTSSALHIEMRTQGLLYGPITLTSVCAEKCLMLLRLIARQDYQHCLRRQHHHVSSITASSIRRATYRVERETERSEGGGGAREVGRGPGEGWGHRFRERTREGMGMRKETAMHTFARPSERGL